MSLSSEFESIVNTYVYKFIDKVSEHYESVDVEELKDIWNKVSNSSQQEHSTVAAKSSKKTTTTSTKASTSSSTSKGCPYMFVRGVNANTLCGKKPREGCVYCIKHKGKEDGEKESPSSISTSSSKKQVVEVKKTTIQKPEIALVKDKKTGNIVHVETQLVVRSATDFVVIGRQNTKGEVALLTPEDVENCKKFGFKFDAERVENDSEEEEEVEEQEEIEEEVEEEVVKEEVKQDKSTDKGKKVVSTKTDTKPLKTEAKTSTTNVVKKITDVSSVVNTKKAIDMASQGDKEKDIEEVLKKLTTASDDEEEEQEEENLEEEE